jgi:hypothetical protein
MKLYDDIISRMLNLLFLTIFLDFAVAYANLLNQDWASVINKLWAAYVVANAAWALLTPRKFREVSVRHSSTACMVRLYRSLPIMNCFFILDDAYVFYRCGSWKEKGQPLPLGRII